MASTAEWMITVLFFGVPVAWLVGIILRAKTEGHGAPIFGLVGSKASLAWWVRGADSSDLHPRNFANGSSPAFAENDAYVDLLGSELGCRVWQEE